MSAKPPTSPRTLAEINKQIIEIKKKIQLSEGQRKAAFEEYETERKLNADQILKLKKEIKELTVSLQKNKDESAVHRVQNLRLETIVGPLANKTTEQVKHAMDLQIIDATKHLDLIRHRIKERQSYLGTLAHEYQSLLAQKPKQEMTKLANPFKKDPKKKCKAKSEGHKTKSAESEIPSPYKKKCYGIQNNIHRVEVQWREAEHVRNSYRAIRSTLLQDRALFESSLRQLEEKKESQQKDVQELQRMNTEAAATRSHARLSLDREERASLLSCRVRERQAAEQQALVAARRQDLERLERRIFQSGKTGGGVPGSIGSPGSGEPESGVLESNGAGGESTGDELGTGREAGSVVEDTGKGVKEAFDKLKEATGATNSDDVLSRFEAQRDTRGRLDYLKKTTEAEKKQLEQKQDSLHAELERYRYAQERDREKFSDDMLNLKKGINDQIELQENLNKKTEEKESLLEVICKTLHNLYLSLKDIGSKPSKDITSNPEHGEVLVEVLYIELEDVVKRSEVIIEEENENEEATEEELPSEDEEIMPSSYNALLRRTPQPVQGHPIPAPLASGAEDEEEVPSRGFLKRQAQLVVDAKSRRKALRIPMNRK